MSKSNDLVVLNLQNKSNRLTDWIVKLSVFVLCIHTCEKNEIVL